MKVPGKIPKKAVKPLMEYCKKLGEKTGKQTAEVFKEHLELMNKYADYFFSDPWPEEKDTPPGFSDKDVEFIEAGKSFEERGERFTLVCLRRNMSMEGFDSEGFTEDFKFYGGQECYDCSVTEAMDLRSEIEQQEKFRRDIEEQMKQKEPSWITQGSYKNLRKPDVVRVYKMVIAKLGLYEEVGLAKDKSCKVRNKYRCPYGEHSEKLILRGMVAYSLWEHIRWYDYHWNKSGTYHPDSAERKWHHYGEPSIIDVTSYKDIREAIMDGRLDKITKEHERYMKEMGVESWAL